jgi:hypothetical protein
VFETILPPEAIEGLSMQCWVIERQRRLNLRILVRAKIISAGTPGGAYQADVLCSYLECEGPRVSRSAFYRWFDEPFERFMAALADRTLAYARTQQADLSGILKVDYIARGQVTWEFFPGTDLEAVLDGHILVLDGRAIDADVRVGNSKHPLHLRLVGVNTPKGYGFFPTNLPPRSARDRWPTSPACGGRSN